MRPVTLVMGPKTFEIDLDDIPLRKRNRMLEDVTNATSDVRWLLRYPMQKIVDPETQEERFENDAEYKVRLADIIGKQEAKREDESEDAYKRRIQRLLLDIAKDKSALAYAALEVIAKAVGQSVPDQDTFEEASWTAIRDFLFTVLSELDIPLANTFRTY